jgi:hypothetical protein
MASIRSHQYGIANRSGVKNRATHHPRDLDRPDPGCGLGVVPRLALALTKQRVAIPQFGEMTGTRKHQREPAPGRSTRAVSAKFRGAKRLTTRSMEPACTGHSVHKSQAAKAISGQLRAARRVAAAEMSGRGRSSRCRAPPQPGRDGNPTRRLAGVVIRLALSSRRGNRRIERVPRLASHPPLLLCNG